MQTALRTCALALLLVSPLVSLSCKRDENENSRTQNQNGTAATPTPPGAQKEVTSTAPQYRVPPIEAPPLERPPVAADRSKLPKGAGGALPTYDGEAFQINLGPAGEQQAAEGQARELIVQVLRAFQWERNPEELRLSRRVASPEPDKGALDAAARRDIEETKKRLAGKLGKLSPATEKDIEERANQNRANAQRAQEVLVFDQHFEGVPIDNTGVRALSQRGRGLVALMGRVFNLVEMGNRRSLDEAGAVAAATRHVSQYTKVLGEGSPEGPRPVPSPDGPLPAPSTAPTAAPSPVPTAQPAPSPDPQRRDDALPQSKPELVILPYGKTMLYAWRLDVQAEEGPYRLWVDAESGKILQLEPQFFSDAASGLTFNISPTVGTEVQGFEVNGPSGGNYALTLTGRIVGANGGADGVTNTPVTISSAGGPPADFNVSPINGATVERTNQAGYNSRFMEVNTYSWVFNHMKNFEGLGSQTFASITVTANHSNPCGDGSVNNACASAVNNTLKFGIGSATTSSSTSSNALFNSGLDATVITHEFGHILSRRQLAVGGGTFTGAISEGLSDFWAATVHNNPTFGAYWEHNSGAPVQTGFVPRLAETLDVFPDHRSLASGSHADGQMINWALWSTRVGLNNQGALGTAVININLLKALETSGIGLTNSGSDKAVHDSYLNLLQQLTTQFGTGSSIHKLCSGFARAGIFLSERDAVVDISDDFLQRGAAAGPTFTVWTGRDYQFSGTTAQAANVFNTRFEIEVANDAAFTVNRVTSGVQSGVTNPAGGVPNGTFTLPVANWNTLKAGDKIFYRVTTTEAGGGNSRISTSPGNGFVASADPPYAVINESGECECKCNTAAIVPATKSFLTWVVLLPLAAAFAWRRRLKGEVRG